MKEIYLLRGLPGAGKSDLAATLESAFKCQGYRVIVACADDYFMVDGEYIFDANKLGRAHQECKHTVECAMDQGWDKIIIANTSTTTKELRPYIKMAEAHDYRVVSLIVENRHGNTNIHDVPDEALERMENRFKVQLI